MGNIDTKSVDIKSLLENQNSQVQDFVNTAISGANTQTIGYVETLGGTIINNANYNAQNLLDNVNNSKGEIIDTVSKITSQNEELKTLLKTLDTTGLLSTVDSLKNIVNNGDNNILSQFTNLSGKLDTVINKTADASSAVMTSGFDKLSNGFDDLSQNVNNMETALQNTVSTGLNGVSNTMNSGFTTLQSGMNTGLNLVESGMNTGFNAVNTSVNTSASMLLNAQNMGNTLLTNTFSSGLSAVGTGLNIVDKSIDTSTDSYKRCCW